MTSSSAIFDIGSILFGSPGLRPYCGGLIMSRSGPSLRDDMILFELDFVYLSKILSVLWFLVFGKVGFYHND